MIFTTPFKQDDYEYVTKDLITPGLKIYYNTFSTRSRYKDTECYCTQHFNSTYHLVESTENSRQSQLINDLIIEKKAYYFPKLDYKHILIKRIKSNSVIQKGYYKMPIWQIRLEEKKWPGNIKIPCPYELNKLKSLEVKPMKRQKRSSQRLARKEKQVYDNYKRINKQKKKSINRHKEYYNNLDEESIFDYKIIYKDINDEGVFKEQTIKNIVSKNYGTAIKKFNLPCSCITSIYRVGRIGDCFIEQLVYKRKKKKTKKKTQNAKTPKKRLSKLVCIIHPETGLPIRIRKNEAEGLEMAYKNIKYISKTEYKLPHLQTTHIPKQKEIKIDPKIIPSNINRSSISYKTITKRVKLVSYDTRLRTEYRYKQVKVPIFKNKEVELTNEIERHGRIEKVAKKIENEQIPYSHVIAKRIEQYKKDNYHALRIRQGRQKSKSKNKSNKQKRIDNNYKFRSNRNMTKWTKFLNKRKK